MPPKRKRTTEAAAATTRNTRSTTRKKTPAPSEDGASSSAEPVNEQAPAAKRARKAPAKTSKAKSSQSKVREQTTDAPSPSPVKAIHDPAPSPNDTLAVKAKPIKPIKPAEFEPYTPERATELFNKYADADDPSVIGADGFFRLCTDAGIAMDGALPILLHWQLKAEDMFKIKKSEWDGGVSELQTASLPTLSIALHDLESLLILNKPPLKPPAGVASTPKKRNTLSACEPYNRSRYYAYAADPKSFDDLYRYCFNLPKADKRVRNIEMDTATAFWSVLLLPRYPLMQDILEFINEKKETYKGVNKDLWQMVLEFCRTISPTLKDYDTDGAWPTMLDDFVTWQRNKTPADDKTSDHN